MTIVQIRPPITVGDFVRKFGYNPDVDASTGPDEDITPLGGTSYLPAAVVAAADIDIASSSANDTAAGTGARTIVIEGLDADYLLQSEEITLNGTTDVHPINDYIRIYRAYVNTVGSGGTNAGNITIDDGSGNVLAYLLADFGQTTQAVYTIPADYTSGWLVQFNVNLANKVSAYVTAVVQVRAFGGAWLTREIFSVSDGSEHDHRYYKPLRLDAKSDIRIRVIDASADNIAVAAGFEIYLER